MSNTGGYQELLEFSRALVKTCGVKFKCHPEGVEKASLEDIKR